jgi:pimeloyl-ACP methyl ester carboxylesterase
VRLNHYRVGSGEPLVLVHGIGSQWQVWSPVIGRLAKERELVAVDLPGFGASPPHPPGTSAGAEGLTRLVAEFLDEQGLERPHVAGNSLGGWIALELAKQGRVRSATALSPAGFATPAENVYIRNMFRVVVRASRLLAPHAEAVYATPLGRATGLGIFIAKPANLSAAAAAESTRALAGAEGFDDTLEAISRSSFEGGERITVPVTIAWAEHDRVLWRRQAARASAAVPGARMLTLTGCGHVPMFDDPEQVAHVILEGSAGA